MLVLVNFTFGLYIHTASGYLKYNITLLHAESILVAETT